MTLFALILAIGIVVDDAIMIVENAWHYIEKGLTPKDAAIKAMGEMTGPVIGITLVLTAVFLPSAFLPGITGQMFRQFALVIASTAIISAINALTLKPAQCALYLKARPADHRPNAFYRGFNKVYGEIEAAYTRLVRWMVNRTGTMAAVFFAVIAVGGWLFSIHPTGFLPSEDQGYAMIMTRLPDGAAQPRLREATRKLDEVLEKTPGIKAWVVIGGLSILDTANLSNASTTFIIYDDWDKRGEALNQSNILGGLKKQLDAHPWPRSGRRFPDDGPGQAQPRPARIAERRAGADPRRLFAIRHRFRQFDLQQPQPPALPRHRPHQGAVAGNPDEQRVRHLAGIPGFGLRQSVQ
jgi:HAE1 family hydrophobic/amphiphilic exporter-1